MIIIAGWIRVDPDDRDAYLAAAAEVPVLARKTAGCLDFVQAADPIEADRVNVFERWESDADVERFRTSGGPEVEMPPITSAEVRKYRISGIESP